MFIKLDLIKQLKNLGLQPGHMIFLHVSMRAVGRILGGPDELHQAIMECIAPDGTLMMYVGCEPEYEAVGRGKFTAIEETEIHDNCPAFNPHMARARRDYGILAEFFRSWPGVISSQNPGARIAAIGDSANWLIANHAIHYGYGEQSPFAKLYDRCGKILLIGSDLDQVTMLHYAEHIAPIKEKRMKHFKVPLMKDGQYIWHDVEEFDTSIGIRQWPDRFFATIVEKYLHENQIKSFKVGNAESFLLDAKSLVDFAVPMFTEAAKKYPC